RKVYQLGDTLAANPIWLSIISRSNKNTLFPLVARRGNFFWKQDIILGLHPPYKRPYTGYGVA
ncbi:MAG: hypothetical protein SWY16_17840, partial [Cyanobacteriota bacterium]|nr:hypothetical protein [Cyanobacteriota bacterium]